jgi:hypothetical protein
MRTRNVLAVCLFALFAGHGRAGEPRCCPPPENTWLNRCRPVGGWCPDCGGLLAWWNPCCFPHCGGPDDYCRKPLPKVCWPPYPPYFVTVPPSSSSQAPAPTPVIPSSAPAK